MISITHFHIDSIIFPSSSPSYEENLTIQKMYCILIDHHQWLSYWSSLWHLQNWHDNHYFSFFFFSFPSKCIFFQIILPHQLKSNLQIHILPLHTLMTVHLEEIEYHLRFSNGWTHYFFYLRFARNTFLTNSKFISIWLTLIVSSVYIIYLNVLLSS